MEESWTCIHIFTRHSPGSQILKRKRKCLWERKRVNVIHFKGNFMLYLTMKEKCKQAKEKKECVWASERETRKKESERFWDVWAAYQLVAGNKTSNPQEGKRIKPKNKEGAYKYDALLHSTQVQFLLSYLKMKKCCSLASILESRVSE